MSPKPTSTRGASFPDPPRFSWKVRQALLPVDQRPLSPHQPTPTPRRLGVALARPTTSASHRPTPPPYPSHHAVPSQRHRVFLFSSIAPPSSSYSNSSSIHPLLCGKIRCPFHFETPAPANFQFSVFSSQFSANSQRFRHHPSSPHLSILFLHIPHSAQSQPILLILPSC